MANGKLVIIGAGGYAKSVVDSLGYRAADVAGFVDERPDKAEHLGWPVLAHGIEGLGRPEAYSYFVAIGSNPKRRAWYERLRALGLPTFSVVDPSALVSPRAELGDMCFVGKLAVVNAGAAVGDDSIVNTMALVEHGCRVGDHVNLSTKSVVNGDVRVGDGCFVGSGAEVVGQVSIGEWSIVGAGAVVTRPVPANVTVAGVPARKIRDGARFW